MTSINRTCTTSPPTSVHDARRVDASTRIPTCAPAGYSLRVLDLFSGIGGFSLGLERAGMVTTAFCEIDPFCRDVLKRHWPDVPIYDDVRTLTADTLRRDGVAVDVICGGFPCQDISPAGSRAGFDGDRSGLWSEFARLIGEVRPRFAIVENSAALLFGGLGRILADLAAIGFDAEWHAIAAAHVGAPHERDRVWVVAYPNTIDGQEGVGFSLTTKRRYSQRKITTAHQYGWRPPRHPSSSGRWVCRLAGPPASNRGRRKRGRPASRRSDRQSNNSNAEKQHVTRWGLGRQRQPRHET